MSQSDLGLGIDSIIMIEVISALVEIRLPP